jgi:hypothetical protein
MSLMSEAILREKQEGRGYVAIQLYKISYVFRFGASYLGMSVDHAYGKKDNLEVMVYVDYKPIFEKNNVTRADVSIRVKDFKSSHAVLESEHMGDVDLSVIRIRYVGNVKIYTKETFDGKIYVEIEGEA